ncbi:MAG: hypothetical protein Kow00109_26290 [Acidobacteriota bacterium]
MKLGKRRWLVGAFILGMLVASLGAARRNSLSARVDVVGGADDNPVVSGLRVQELADDYFLTWGLYPHLELRSEGAASVVTLYYSFGMNRVDTELDLDSESHGVGLAWEVRGERLTLTLSENFRRSPDFTTFNLFQGIVFTPEGMFFNYDTIALRRNSNENTASLELEYQISGSSYWRAGGGHSLREYEQDPRFNRRLADQDQVRAFTGYRYQFTESTSFLTDYRFSHYNFRTGGYPDGRTHDLVFGLDHALSPTVQLRMEAGPSYVELIGTDLAFWGYNASIGLSKYWEKEFVDIYYRRDNTASVGVGSLSKTHRLGFGFSKLFGPSFSTNFGLALFETERIFDNPVDFRGVQGSLVLQWLLARNIALNVGASYLSQEENSDFPELGLVGLYDLDRRRAWVSLRFDLPDFWRF